jgi:hypothetical protein
MGMGIDTYVAIKGRKLGLDSKRKFTGIADKTKLYSIVLRCGLLVLILFWKASPSVRMCLGTALALYVVGDILTFTFFYPRNDVMFKTAQAG